MRISDVFKDPGRKARILERKRRVVKDAPVVTKMMVGQALTGGWLTSHAISVRACGSNYTPAHWFRVSMRLDRLCAEHIAQKKLTGGTWYYTENHEEQN